MLLTDEEIKEAVGFTTDQMTAYRRVESALLEKLNAQEPACFVGRIEYGAMLLMSMPDDWVATPLYEYPIPPADVVRDAERLDWIQANCRCDPMMDGQHKWWPTNFNKCLTGPSIREAIDAAMEKMK